MYVGVCLFSFSVSSLLLGFLSVRKEKKIPTSFVDYSMLHALNNPKKVKKLFQFDIYTG